MNTFIVDAFLSAKGKYEEHLIRMNQAAHAAWDIYVRQKDAVSPLDWHKAHYTSYRLTSEHAVFVFTRGPDRNEPEYETLIIPVDVIELAAEREHALLSEAIAAFIKSGADT